jgi:hypothetical protein
MLNLESYSQVTKMKMSEFLLFGDKDVLKMKQKDKSL